MISDILKEMVSEVMEQRLRDPAQRELVTQTIMEGFATVRKKPVPDLPARLKKLQNRVYQMTESVSLGFVNGRLVVTVAGSSESLMKELRLGTDWYDPWSKVDETLLAAILTDPEK